MKHYKELLELQCFTRADVKRITGSPTAANSILTSYQKKGYIESVKRNLYAAISIETGHAMPSRYRVASSITEGAHISHHSAFEYYGCANQVFYEVYVSGAKRFAPFEYDGIAYRYIAPRMDLGVDEKSDGVRVTDIERTVLDSINDFDKIAGLEELLRCLELIPRVDEEKLLSYLERYNKQVLYQKSGYLLSHFKEVLRLSERFFEACESRVSKSIRYLYVGVAYEKKTFDSHWKLFVPNNIMKLLSQGGELYGDI